MSKRVMRFYARISKDPEKFARDPEGTMEKYGLSEEEKKIVRRRSKEALRVFFGVNPLAFDTTAPPPILPEKPEKPPEKPPEETSKKRKAVGKS